MSETVSNSKPDWRSYQQTGNPADIVDSPAVAGAIGGKVDASGGNSVDQNIGTPKITGGVATNLETSTSISTASNGQVSGTFSRLHSERAMSLPQPHDFLTGTQTVEGLLGGQIDCAPIINAAFAAGVRCLTFPAGTYLIASQVSIPSNACIRGIGQQTIFSITDIGDDIFLASGVQYIDIRDCVMRANAIRTGGAAIKLYQTFHVIIRHVIFDYGSGRHWTGISLDGANDTHIEDAEGRGGGAHYGIEITGTNKRSEDTYIDSTNLNGYATNLVLTWASGVFLNGMDILSSLGDGILFNPGSSQEVDGVRASTVLCDSNAGAGIHVAGTGAISEVNFTNCWASTNGSPSVASDGLILNNSAVQGFTISSSDFHNNFGNGINVLLGQNIVLNGNTICMNSVAGSGKYNGITVNGGSNVYSIVICGNIIGAGQAHPDGVNQGKTTNYQNYGILVGSTFSGYAAITGNVTHGHVTGGTSIPSASTIAASANIGN